MKLHILLKDVDNFLKLKRIREDVRIRYTVLLMLFKSWYVEEKYPTNASQNYDEYLKNKGTNIELRDESRIILEEFLEWIENGRFQMQDNLELEMLDIKQSLESKGIDLDDLKEKLGK